MGSSLTVTNDKENETWWILEENHKGVMYGVGIPLGAIAGAVVGAALIVGTGGSVIPAGSLLVTYFVGEGIAVSALTVGASATIGGVAGAVMTVKSIEYKSHKFREKMIQENRTILKPGHVYQSKRHTLSLLRTITAKRFDATNHRFHEISFNAWSGATNNSVNEYRLSEYNATEVDVGVVDVAFTARVGAYEAGELDLLQHPERYETEFGRATYNEQQFLEENTN